MRKLVNELSEDIIYSKKKISVTNFVKILVVFLLSNHVLFEVLGGRYAGFVRPKLYVKSFLTLGNVVVDHY